MNAVVEVRRIQTAQLMTEVDAKSLLTAIGMTKLFIEHYVGESKTVWVDLDYKGQLSVYKPSGELLIFFKPNAEETAAISPLLKQNDSNASETSQPKRG